MSNARLALLRWLPIAAAALLLALAHRGVPAQPTAAQAAAEGRTAISGAQGGPGGQPGLAQGGLGVQGGTAAQIEVPLRRPGKVVRAEDVKPEPGERTLNLVGPSTPDRSEPVPRKSDDVKALSGTQRKTERALKRTQERARHGVPGVDATGS